MDVSAKGNMFSNFFKSSASPVVKVQIGEHVLSLDCHWVFSKCLALLGLKSKRNVPNKAPPVEHPHTNLQTKTLLFCTTSQVHSMYYGVYYFTYTCMYIPSKLPHGHVFQTKSKNTTMRVWRVREWQQL